jgi:AraC family transcriptional regulator
MTVDLTPRFVHRPGFLLAGLRRWHTFADTAVGIPAQWQEFFGVVEQLRPVDGRTYGAMCASEAGRIEYLCGVEVADLSVVLHDVGRLRVPSALYAVFEHRVTLATLRDTWQYAYQVWVPQSGYRILNSPEFEEYSADFQPSHSTGGVSIWFPVLLNDRNQADGHL